MSLAPELPRLQSLMKTLTRQLDDVANTAPTETMRTQARELLAKLAENHSELVARLPEAEETAARAVAEAKATTQAARKASREASARNQKKQDEWVKKQSRLAEKRKSKKKPVDEVDHALGSELRTRLLARLRLHEQDDLTQTDTGDFSDWLRQ